MAKWRISKEDGGSEAFRRGQDSSSISVLCTGESEGACESCRGGCGDSDATIVSLKDMEIGESGTIVRLTSDDDSIIRRLISMGFVPSRTLQLASAVSSKGARVVRIGYATIALDAEMASAVFVRRGRRLAKHTGSSDRTA